MVKFILKEKIGTTFTYEYFPEDDTSKEAGIIVVDVSAGSVNIEKVAEKDFECFTSVEELNEMRDAINEMRKENGKPPLTEEECSSTPEDSAWYFYADHAINKLCDLFNNGEEPTEGVSMWY